MLRSVDKTRVKTVSMCVRSHRIASYVITLSVYCAQSTGVDSMCDVLTLARLMIGVTAETDKESSAKPRHERHGLNRLI